MRRTLDERGRPIPLHVNYAGRFTYGLQALEIHAWDDSTQLVVGSFNSIAGGVTVLLGGNHRTDWLTTFPFGHIFDSLFPEGAVSGTSGHPATKGDVTIENDCWIGQGATLLSGSRLANGAVLAAKSVLTGITVPYGIYAGVPARLVRLRFDPETIDSLVDMAWWDWPVENIRKAIPILQSPPSPTSIEQLRTVGPNL